MSEFCNTCLKRSTCDSICPELELHLKEIEVSQRELPIPVTYRHRDIEWPSSPSIKMTRREREIVTLLGKGLSRAEVCEVLNITRGNLRRFLTILNKKRGKM